MFTESITRGVSLHDGGAPEEFPKSPRRVPEEFPKSPRKVPEELPILIFESELLCERPSLYYHDVLRATWQHLY